MSEKEFYKKIHPDMFSDSIKSKKSKLSKEFFSYFLESLTSQSKEKEFEDYCRKLVESTICPNLLPQTGPTGGGDSKVDSETYPVAESIAERWLFGYGDQAHVERWAFAISAKKEWKSKIKSDVKKIIGTNEDLNRGYTKIFFLTNQFVSDKKRAEAEDELRAQYNIDVRILDRTWLIDKTFINENQKIAIDAFNMSDELQDTIIEGKRDSERKERLKEIDVELNNIEQVKPARIVKLSKEAVDLVRQLEPDKSTTVAILERNIRIAKRYGNHKDYANALYDYCWTMVWWYEDRDKFYEVYKELESLYCEFQNIYPILKLLSTLWITLNSIHNSGNKTIDNMEEHTKLILDSFNSFINDSENSKTAMLARFDYQLIRMQQTETREFVVCEYISILDNMGFNNDIDLKILKQVIELPILKNSPKYDGLFEKLIEKLGEQSKNIQSSQLLLNRGDDYLEKDPYYAIRFYSRALTRLYNEESKIDLIKTFLKLGYAFEEVGLRWGARSYYVKAFIDSFNVYFSEGYVIPGLFLSARSLKYLELSLGRVEYSVQFNELELMSESIYPYNLEDKKQDERYRYYDILLAASFLKNSIKNVSNFNKLPDYLGDIGLIMSSAALKYQLGYYDDDYVEALGSKEAVDEFMQALIEQATIEQIQNNIKPIFFSERSCLESKIMGCSISIVVPNNSVTLEFGATILAMFENIYATSVSDEMIPMISSFCIDIIVNEGDEFSIGLEQVDNTIAIKITQINGLLDKENKDELYEKLMSIMTMLIVQITRREDDLKKLKKVVEDENALFRCMNFSSTLNTFLTSGDAFFDLNDKTDGKNIYVKNREDDIDFSIDDESENSPEPLKIHYGSPSDGMDFSRVRHDSVHVSDVIYAPLWDQAHWLGISVISDYEFRHPPIVGLIFENKKGRNIFRKWIDEKKTSKIQIGIITSIDKNNQFWYRVIIGDNHIESEIQKSSGHVVFANINRLHTMEAINDNNIKILKKSMEHNKEFMICPILKEEIRQGVKSLRKDLCMKLDMKQIILKDAREIMEKDLFLINGLMPSDKPVNPNQEEMFAEVIIKEKRRFLTDRK